VRSVLSVRSHEGSCADEQIPSIVKRITNLKKSAVCLEHSLPVSFQNVRGELDILWNNLESIKHLISGSPQDCAGSTPLFQGRHSLNSMPPLEMLLPSALQVLMRQVVDELRSLGFVTRDKMEARGTTGPDQAVTDQLSGLGRRLGLVERQFTESDGTLSKMEGRIVSLEDRHAADSIEHSVKAFQDIRAVAAWVQNFEYKDLFQYCVNMVTLIMLCANPYKTIAEGMATATAAHKAKYNSLTEAHISLSYGLTYPGNLMKKYDKEKHAAMKGWFWTTTWSSYAVFKGTFNNGAKDNFLSSLVEVSRMIQNVIDFAFPLMTHPLPHAVFTQ
jgi:hypothetical protein